MPTAKTSEESFEQPLPLWRHGFRPFFLGGCFFAVLVIAVWWLLVNGVVVLTVHGGTYWWHGHELIFGFVMAIVYGFLLTAVQNWTGIRGSFGNELMVLFALWAIARGLLFVPSVASYAVVPDLLFMVAANLVFGRSLVQARQWKNFFIFIPLLLLLTVLNGVSYWALDEQKIFAPYFHGAILLVVFMMSLMASRVVPFFLGNAFSIPQPRPPQFVELTGAVALLLVALLAIVGFYRVPSWLLVSVTLLACALQCIKVVYWFDVRVRRKSLLWSLFTAYVFIPLGLFFLALFGFKVLQNLSLVLHTFTVGGMGGLVLAMAARVALGHTGRKMQLPPAMPIALVLIFIGGVARVFLPLVGVTDYALALNLTTLCWIIAFLIFTVSYLPILSSPRVDGKPG